MKNLSDYVKEIERALAAGNTTEHSHRPALKSLIESLENNIHATNEPKRVQCGAPDFIISRNGIPIGYIETKDVGKSLDLAEREDQMKRYRAFLGNLLLTDYLEFRWYVGGERRLTARLASIDSKGKLKIRKDGIKEVSALLDTFLHTAAILINNPRDLAIRMAAYGRHIHDAILRALADEDGGGELRKQMEGFRQVLLHDLTEGRFADMYAQTICYGLFAARCHHSSKNGEFVRERAAYELPKTNPFLRRMFNHMAGPDLDNRVVWIVEDLSNLLRLTDMEAILQDFGRRTRREDPVVHFYETFLAAYDPKMRESRGVYYTPQPVVSFIVRSIDHILKTEFGLKQGLADSTRIRFRPEKEIHKVLILDPATGTGTFLYGIIKLIHEAFAKNKGMWSGYVSDHLLPRLFGFELLMAPYAVAHMKLALQLAETGYDFGADERLGIYLTNTLEEVFRLEDVPPFTDWLIREAEAASRVKSEMPVMVILGNPPYSGHSANKGKWITALLRGEDTHTGHETHSYFEVDGKPLGERNPKWLNDDYVKFIRFAQHRIEQTGYGVLAFITNHGYLDNPTFRGMRQSLLETFDTIYVIDLHGNSKKKERCPDGSKDENVFDIQQGVAIGIFIKRADAKRPAEANHAHLWGVREISEKNKGGEVEITGGKYFWLARNDVATVKWTKLQPKSPFYLFAPQDENLRAEYDQYWKITEVMPVNVLGFQTHRDHFAIDFELSNLRSRIANMSDSSIDDEEFRARFELGKWDIKSARSKIQNLKNWEEKFIECLYRPFDKRFCFFHDAVIDRPRRGLLDHVAGKENLCLNTVRQTKMESWQHVIASNAPSPAVYVELKDGSNVFPLYLYPTGNLFDASSGSDKRQPNIVPSFISASESSLKLSFIPDGKGDLVTTFGPEDIFNYMYAVFHSSEYRRRYAEFLKIDFPRLPLTSNIELFRELCRIGGELAGLHLLEKEIPLISNYPAAGDNMIENVRYTEPGQGNSQGCVWINKSQFFEGVPPEVWNFFIGGYQVCRKWLKDRKRRTLTYDDQVHYCRVVAAISATIRLMAAIDEIISKHGGWPIK